MAINIQDLVVKNPMMYYRAAKQQQISAEYAKGIIQTAAKNTDVGKFITTHFSKISRGITALSIALYAKNTLDSLNVALEVRSNVIAETKNGYGTGQRA